MGFNNSVAIMALLLGLISIGAIAQVSRLRGRFLSPAHPVILANAARPQDRVSRVLIIISGVLTVATVVTTAVFFWSHPFGDSAYFVDRLLYLVNGSRFYLDFEFAYGPLMLYPPYVLWLLIRPLGGGIYLAYYMFMGAWHLLGIGMLVYTVNRLDLSRALRNALVASAVPVMIFCIPTIGPNYSLTRFLLPFFLITWTFSVLRKHNWTNVVAPGGATLLGFAVSPEMGVVTGVSIAIAFALFGSRERWKVWVGAGLGMVVSGTGWALYGQARGSALAGFSAGNANFPLLPGQPAVAYIVIMVALAWSAGASMDLRQPSRFAAQLGWIAAVGALVIPALGRADWVHLYWNGLGAILMATACLWVGARRLAWGLPLAATGTFIVSSIVLFLVAGVPSAYLSGVNNGVISMNASRGLAHRIGRSYSDGRSWWLRAKLEGPTEEDVRRLSEEGGVFCASWLNDRFGAVLAERHALAPVFEVPVTLGSEAQTDYLVHGLGHANSVLIPKYQYDDYDRRLDEMRRNGWSAMRRTKVSSSLYEYSALLGFPLSARPANAALNAQVVFAQALKRDWVVDRRSGDYLILRRRGVLR